MQYQSRNFFVFIEARRLYIINRYGKGCLRVESIFQKEIVYSQWCSSTAYLVYYHISDGKGSGCP